MTTENISIVYIDALCFFACYLGKSGMKKLEMGIKLAIIVKELL